MLARSATAPGKLFLVGEYAVLEGGAAVLCAVSQSARVAIEPDCGDEGRVLIWTDAERELPLHEVPLLTAVTEVLERRGLIDRHQLGSCTIELDTHEFYRGRRKLGLGSSAALTAALVKALHPAPVDADYADLAIACHRHLQGGGSGADVATSLAGDFTRFEAGRLVSGSLRKPEGLHFLFPWTGKPASTPNLLGHLQAFKARNAVEYHRLLEPLRALASKTADAFQRGAAGDFLAGLEQYDARLEALSRRSGIGFYSDVHLRLRERVASLGAIYKPSGAGGGDFGIVASTSREIIRRVARSLTSEGFDTSIACSRTNQEQGTCL